MRDSTFLSVRLCSASEIHLPTWRISGSFMPRVVSAGVPMRMPLGFIGGFVSNGIAFLFTVMPASCSAFSASLAGDALGEDVHQHQVSVGAAGNDVEALVGQRLRQRLGVGDDLACVVLEIRAAAPRGSTPPWRQ